MLGYSLKIKLGFVILRFLWLITDPVTSVRTSGYAFLVESTEANSTTTRHGYWVIVRHPTAMLAPELAVRRNGTLGI